MSQNTPKIKLYSYSTSPYGQKVSCYLNYKQLDYTFIPVNPLTSEEIKFSNQTQVPVVMIEDEWKNESSKIGIWLDEHFPEKPLLPDDTDEVEKLMLIDDWISDNLYPVFFRLIIQRDVGVMDSIKNGWIMSHALDDSQKLPFYIKYGYPWVVKKIPFIRHMMHGLDLNESVDDMVLRMEKEFVQHLDSGPFLGGMSAPTLADFSAYPAVAQKYCMGVTEKRPYLDNPTISDWCKRVNSHFTGNPFLMSDHLLKREIK